MQGVDKAIRECPQHDVDKAWELAADFAPLVTQRTGDAAPGPGHVLFKTAVLKYSAAMSQRPLQLVAADMGMQYSQAGEWFRNNDWHESSNFTTAHEMAEKAIRLNRHPALGPFKVPREDLLGTVNFFGRGECSSPILPPWNPDLPADDPYV